MAYSSRHRYSSRREKLQKGLRAWKVGIIFFLIAAAVWIFKDRYTIWNWLETYFTKRIHHNVTVL